MRARCGTKRDREHGSAPHPWADAVTKRPVLSQRSARVSETEKIGVRATEIGEWRDRHKESKLRLAADRHRGLQETPLLVTPPVRIMESIHRHTESGRLTDFSVGPRSFGRGLA
jgi:hypothetical protein